MVKLSRYPLEKTKRDELIRYYKDGWSIFELKKEFNVNESTVIQVIRRQRFKKKNLYKVFEKQIIRQDNGQQDFTTKEKKLLNKFFPKSDGHITKTYYTYWKVENKRRDEEKKNCAHHVRHIRCSSCNKILGDAPQTEPILNLHLREGLQTS